MVGRRGWKILGSETRAVRKNTSRGEGNPIQISGRGLGYLAAFLIELRSRQMSK